MNRVTFMNELEYLLQDLPEVEKQEAIQYYNDYFEEVDDEVSLIEELGSPAKVAAIIKDGLGEEVNQSGEYSETGYQDERFNRRQELDRRTYLDKSNYNYKEFREQRQSEREKQQGTQEKEQEDVHSKYREYEAEKSATSKGLKIALIVILCIFALPIGGSLLIAAGATIIGLAAAAIGLAVALVVAVAAIGIAGVAVFCGGIASIVIAPAEGLVLCGTGLVLVAFGLLGVLGFAALASKVIPAVIRGVVALFSIPFKNKRR